MRKSITVVLTSCSMLLSGIFLSDAHAREMRTLYRYLKDMGTVKVYVAEVKDSSGQAKADIKALRKDLENALATRMNLDFDIVGAPEAADIIVGCNITEFYWTDEDPIDNITGTAAIVMDYIQKDDYGRIQAVFTVNDREKGSVIWERLLKATITSKSMLEEESIHLLNERIISIFERECLSSKHGRGSSGPARAHSLIQ